MGTLRAFGLIACLAVCHTLSNRSEAGTTITFVLFGGNVVETGSGRINVAALTNLGSAFLPDPGVYPSVANASLDLKQA